MALLLIDGFEGYGTSTGAAPSPTGVMARRYTVSSESTMDIETGRIGGYCIELASSSGCYFQTPALTTNDTLIIGFAFNHVQGAATYNICQLQDGATIGINLQWVTGTGELRLRRGSTTLGTTSGLGLTVGSWYWIELKVKCNNTTGTYELRVGTSNVLSASSVDTQEGTNAYHDRVRFASTTGTLLCVDDFYVCDSSGTSNNDFLNNCKVTAVRPDGAGNSTQWVPSAGANYACMDEIIADDDTTYVEESTASDLDLYTFASVGSLTSIKGIQINVDCRETDATSFDIKIPIRSGVTNYDGTGQTIGSTSYVAKSRVAEQDPNTSAAWTAGNIDAAEFGVKVG